MSKVVEVGTFGLVQDVFGEEAAAEAALRAGQLQAGAAGRAESGIQQRFEATQEMLRPGIEAGDVARQQQMALLGLSGTEAQQAATAQLSESPAQQFLRGRAQKNLLQNAAAIGGIGGGDVRSALVQQGVGFAQQDIENQFRRLQGLSAPGTQTAVQTGVLGGQAAQQAGQAIQAGGQALAGGQLGAAQAAAQGRGQFMQLAGLGIGAATGGASLPFTSAGGGAGAPGFGISFI